MRIYRLLSLSIIEKDRCISTFAMYSLNKYHKRSNKILSSVDVKQLKRKVV